MFCAVLPQVLLAPLAGVLVDRSSKKRIIVAMDTAMGLSMLSIAIPFLLLEWSPIQVVYWLMAVVAINGVCAAFFQPAMFAIVPSIVEKRQLDDANSLLSAANATASVLYEWSDRTRFAAAWHSEVETDEDVEVELKRSTLPPPIVDAINRAGDDVDATIRTPQLVNLGAYHEFDNGWSATVDAIWVEFSQFGLTELSVHDEELDEADMNFQDFWIVTAGFAFPITDRLEGRVGAMYMEQPVDDDDRTFSFALDEVYGAGIGFRYDRRNRDSIEVNLTVLNTGDAPVDTGVETVLSPRGRVVGEDDDPYAVALEFTYHWN